MYLRKRRHYGMFILHEYSWLRVPPILLGTKAYKQLTHFNVQFKVFGSCEFLKLRMMFSCPLTNSQSQIVLQRGTNEKIMIC